MNLKQIQFNRQWRGALLLAGLILTLAAGLAWAGAEASGLTFQPAKIAQDCAYAPQPGQTGPSAVEVDCPKADLGKNKDGLRPWPHLKSIKGGKGGVTGGDVHR